ncbi:unnamed protein product [Gordionus sp. m RMFG-2023]
MIGAFEDHPMIRSSSGANPVIQILKLFLLLATSNSGFLRKFLNLDSILLLSVFTNISDGCFPNHDPYSLSILGRPEQD